MRVRSPARPGPAREAVPRSPASRRPPGVQRERWRVGRRLRPIASPTALALPSLRLQQELPASIVNGQQGSDAANFSSEVSSNGLPAFSRANACRPTDTSRELPSFAAQPLLAEGEGRCSNPEPALWVGGRQSANEKNLADGVGFEPTEPLQARWFSRPVHSTALPPVRSERVLRPGTAGRQGV